VSQEIALPIKEFAGLNIREPVGAIKDNELSKCINFDLGRAGELTKRTGFEQVHDGSYLGANAIRLIGLYITSSISQFIARAGNAIYRSNDGLVWTVIGSYNVEYGVQYADKFYMVRKDGVILEWNGSTITTITGSPTGTFCIIHKERLFVLNTEGTGPLNSRVWFSLAGDITATGWIGTNTFDVKAGDGDFLTCGAIVNDVLMLFKSRSTWGMYVQGTSSVDWILRSLHPKIGCVSKYTPKEIENVVYFVSSRAVYKTDGTSFVDISEPIASVLRNRVVNVSTLHLDSAAWWEDKYICLLQPDTVTIKYYVYHIRAKGWTEWQFPGSVPIKPGSFIEVETATPQRGLYAGDFNTLGKVYRYGANVYTDVGISYDSTLETKEYDFKLMANYKRGKWIVLDSLGVAALTLTNIIDTVERTPKTVNSLSTRRSLKTGGPGYFRAWRYRLLAVGTDSFTLYGLTMFIHHKRTVMKVST
jgi:hypothetical protein